MVVTGQAPDPVLRQIVAPVADVRFVDGLVGLDALLRAEAARGAVLERIELVGHSCGPDHILVLGLDELDPGQWHIEIALVRLGTALLACGCTEVRLVGCNTAATPAARRALSGMAVVLGVTVSGTTAPLRPGDMAPGGLSRSFEHHLWSTDPQAVRPLGGARAYPR